MNTSLSTPGLVSTVPWLNNLPQTTKSSAASRPWIGGFKALFAGLLLLLLGAPFARAHQSPAGCTGSGLGILLFTDSPDVHIGDTLNYSVTVFNGTGGPGPVVCDATSIQASIVTPDGVTHLITLVRTNMSNGDSDFYANAASYVVRSQDIRPDGTVRATASDTGVVHQNDTDSQGGGNQGVNTEVSLPCIILTAQCTGSIGENGLITFSGTVTNCGNNTLGNVSVTNNVNGAPVQVMFVANLPAGQGFAFSGSYVPANPCGPSTAILVAQGVDEFTSHPKPVTSSVSTTCSDVLTAGIKVTKACPVAPVFPGQLLIFSGSVSNTGNVTLTNVVVVDNQPAPNTVVFTTASLAPGTVTNFTASYTAPATCSVSDTLVATATSRCGTQVSDNASATCAIATAPGISVTEVCPVTQGVSGGTSSFSGIVQNTGNITLNNVTVTSDRPAPNTVVATIGTLAPGASANYSRNFTVPNNVCNVTTTVTATGNDSCSNAGVTNTATATCPITTAPAIAVTLACPSVQATNGGPITYTGTVLNSGNVTLNNIVVTDTQSTPPTVLTIASLLPGASTNFTASFITPTNVCTVSSTVTASGSDNCSLIVVSNSTSATCTLATAPRIVVVQNCSGDAVSPGGTLTYSGSVSNAGNITLTNIVITNDHTGNTPVFATAFLLPGDTTNFTGSYNVPVGTDCSITSTLSVRARDNCSGNLVTNAASATCSVTGTPLIAVTLNCPANQVVTGNPITFSGTVRNPGNVTLINVTVVDNQASPATVLTVPSLAPGGSANFTATFASPANACTVTSVVTARGSNTCAGVVATDTESATCTLLTTPAMVVRQNCPLVPTSAGGLLTYSGSVSNSGNITLTNIVVSNSQTGTNAIFTAANLAPGAVSNYTGSYTVPLGTLCTVSSTSTATANEICSGNALTNTVTSVCSLTTAPGITVTLNCPDLTTMPGALITYFGTVHNSGDVTLNNVTVTDNQTSPALVFTAASLASGASANFTASFITPLNACSVSSTVIARGTDACSSAGVTNTASATCPLGTAASVVITENCSTNAINPGGFLTFSGSVSNSGNIALTNVVVTSDHTGVTPILTVSNLPIHGVTNYSGSYAVVADGACSSTTVVFVRGNDICSGIQTTNTASVTCAITGNPRIVVTQTCPLIEASPGGTLNYSGTVSNAGNVVLTNVVVLNNRSGVVPIYTNASMAPGVSATFQGSYLVPTNCCSVSSTVTATGATPCSGVAVSDTQTTTCTLLTTPSLVVTKVCPLLPVGPGDLLKLSGSISNSGNITLLDVTLTVTPGTTVALTPNRVMKAALPNAQTNRSPVLNFPITLAPGESVNYTTSYTVPQDFCGLDTVTASGFDSCTGQHVVSTVTSTCPFVTAPSIAVIKNCPAQPTAKGGLYVFTGMVTNTGNVTLTNVYVVNDQPTNNTPIIGPITLAPGRSTNFTGSYTAPTCCCAITDTLTASGADQCSGNYVFNTASAQCPLLTTPRIMVVEQCPSVNVPVGGLYQFTGSVTNTGDVVLTNVQVFANQPVANTLLLGPIELAPGESKTFSGSFTVVSGSGNLVVTTSGFDTCQGRLANAAANCSGPINVAPEPRALTVIVHGNGTVSGVANNQILNIGQSYTATAAPAAGSSFVNWSGGVSATTATLHFTMQSNLVIIATFVSNGTNGSNVFIPRAGVFNGLFFNPKDLQSDNSGAFSLTMTASGSYKASLQNGSKKYAVKGLLDSNGQASNTITRKGNNPLVVNWQGSLTDPDYIGGTVTDGSDIADLDGGRDVFTAGNPAPQAGHYTLIIPGILDATNSPAGDGYGTVTIDTSGTVNFKGRLADDSTAVQTVALSKQGEWPLYVSLYSGKGLLIGWLRVADDGTNDIFGTLGWMKPSLATGALYKAGFWTDSSAIGSRYVAPTGSASMLQITGGLVLLNGGNLPDSTNHVTFGPNSKLVNNGTNTLTLTFTPKSGLFTGKFKETGSTETFIIKGAVLQRQNNASGYAPGADQSGRVLFEAAP